MRFQPTVYVDDGRLTGLQALKHACDALHIGVSALGISLRLLLLHIGEHHHLRLQLLHPPICRQSGTHLHQRTACTAISHASQQLVQVEGIRSCPWLLVLSSVRCYVEGGGAVSILGGVLFFSLPEVAFPCEAVLGQRVFSVANHASQLACLLQQPSSQPGHGGLAVGTHQRNGVQLARWIVCRV